MAAKKAAKDDPPEESPFAELSEGEEEDLIAFVEGVGASISSIFVYRIKPDGGRPYVGQIPIDVLRENPMEYLREHFGSPPGVGGGKFFLQFRDGFRRIRASRTIEVDPKPGAEAAGGASVAGGSFHDQHMALLREQIAQQQTLMMSLIAAQKPPAPPDTGAMLQGIAAMMAAVQPKQALDPSAMLTAVATVFTTLRGPANDDPFQRAKTIIELAKDITGGDHDDSLFGVVKAVGKEVVTRLLPAGPAGQQVPAETEIVVPAGVHVIPRTEPPAAPIAAAPAGGAAPTVAASAPGMLPAEQVAQLIRQGLLYLKTRALQGKPVELYVDRIFTDDDEPQWLAIIGAIRQGATFENLVIFDPEIGQNATLTAWFKTLYGIMRDELFQSMDTARTRGNGDHVTKDAGSGASGTFVAGSPATGANIRESAGN